MAAPTAKHTSNAPVLMGNACQRSTDAPMDASLKFITTTAALPGYNTTLAYTGADLVAADTARLGLATSAQQYFVIPVGMFGILCWTPIIGTAAALADATDANRKWAKARAFGFKMRSGDSTPAYNLIPSKAEFMWEISVRTSQLTAVDGHIAIPATRPAHAAVTYFADLTFKVNTSTENVVDATRGDGVRKRGEIADGALSIESDVADFDYVVITGSMLVPDGESGGTASSLSGIYTGV